jgi:sulfhydrogenase subunit delta
MNEKPFEKIKIGWFVFSCSEDNTIMFTELMNDHWQEWKRIFDFRHVKVLKKNNIFDEFDVAFVEGAIASPAHEDKLKDIRSRSKKVVAVGACAVAGLPASQRNTFTPEQKESIQFLVDRFGALPEVKKVSDVVEIDASVPGCPMNTDMFLKAVNALVLELRPDYKPQPPTPLNVG